MAADFLSSLDKPSLWYKMNKEDKTPLTFLNNLIGGLEIGFDLSRGNIENTRSDKTTGKLEDKIQHFFNLLYEINPPVFFIVLDDFQNTGDDEIFCDIIGYFIDNLPSFAHIIIISTVSPCLDLTKFRAEKELVELFDYDFEFTFEEAKKLSSKVYELNIEDDTLERIVQITRGWITGITYLFEHLSKLTQKEQKRYLERFFHYKDLQSIDDFLREEIIDVLKPEIASLLIRSSLFDVVNAEILLLFNEKGGDDLFQEIKTCTTFIETESDESVNFSYAPLFSAFLQRMFRELPELERINAHFIAGNYYYEKNEYEKAIEHFFKSGQRDEAKKAFISIVDNLLDNGEYETAQKIFRLFSKQELVQSPLLSYYDGLVMNLITPFSSRKNLLGLLPYFREKKDYLREARIYRELLSNYLFYMENEELVNELTDMALEFLNYAEKKLPTDKMEILNAFVTLGNWGTGNVDNRPYEAALRAEETSYKFQSEETLLCSRLVLSKIYIYKGEFAYSLKLLEKTAKIFEKYPLKHPYMALISFSLGDSYFYLGEIEKAIEITKRALENLKEGFAVNRFLKLNLIFFYLYTDEFDKAEVIFEQEREKEIGENLYLQYFWMYLLQMFIAYRNDNSRRAEYYCKRLMEPDNCQILKQDYPYSYIAISEINIYIGDYSAAEDYLGIILEDKMEKENPYAYATAVALFGYLKNLKGEAVLSGKYFEKMNTIIQNYGFKNLDICNPELLQKIAKVCGYQVFDLFPRLAGTKDISLPTVNLEKCNLEFKTLGTFQVFIKGREIQQGELVRQKRVTDLLMILLVFRDAGISKEIVYETFWPGYSYKSARDNLNTIVYRLRKMLNDENNFLSTKMNIIKLKEGTYSLDVDHFMRYIRQGKASESIKDIDSAIINYNHAEKFYGGDFLKSESYIDFIRDEREKLHNTYKQLLFSLIKLSLDTNQYVESLNWANKLIGIDPLCEPAYRLLMIASVLTDNRSEITRFFEKLKIVLKENYNISPDQKTIKLKEILLSEIVPDSGLWRNETII